MPGEPQHDTPQPTTDWNEDSSQVFIDYGCYFVPAREQQMAIICALIPPRDASFCVLELCCGEGLLAQAILQQFPHSTVHGFDGSHQMLAAAQQRLAALGDRFVPQRFDLFARNWRRPDWQAHAVVSSLAIHHLDAAQKQQLYRDVYAMLAPGGVFIIADLIQPASAQGEQLAAAAWDAAVQERALALTGNSAPFDYFRTERWNIFRYPDPMDKPSGLFEQLYWLHEASFHAVDVYWLQAGHAIYGGCKPA